MQADTEDEHVEFKEAKNNLHSGDLPEYCCALANEGGGKLILGVTNKKPRQVVGSRAYREPHLVTKREELYSELGIRVETQIIRHPDGPVIVFNIPPHHLGLPIRYKGTYWMRSGEQLVPMSDDMLKRIYAEATPDFSAQVCAEATFADLAPEAIEEFRKRWMQKSGNKRLAALEPERLLADAELVVDGGVTIAALVLFGARQALGRHLAQAEVIFEYRSRQGAIRYQDRKAYREAFFTYYDDLWNTINLRNEVHQYQEGLFRRDIWAFNGVVIREAILNAVSHRDYRRGDSTMVLQTPDALHVISDGGLPEGITVENILNKRSWRNRLIAESFEKCGLVERSGQGMDLMFEQSIIEAKLPPDFTGTDAHKVSVTLSANVENPVFLRFLEQVNREQAEHLILADLLVLDRVRRHQSIPDNLRGNLRRLRERGIVEARGRARGTTYLLSEKYYAFVGQSGTYTRELGLDRETCKELLLSHIQRHADDGTRLSELVQVLPDKTYEHVRWLIYGLRDEGLTHSTGRGRGARWFPGPSPK